MLSQKIIPIGLCGHAAVLAVSLLGLAEQAVGQSLTIYYAPGQTPLANGSVSTATPTAYDDSLQAYNTATLVAPTPPGSSTMPTAFPLVVPSAVPVGASIQHSGSFFGFSIEMSVVNQVCAYHFFLSLFK